MLKAWGSYLNQIKEMRNVAKGPPILVTGTHRSGTTWVGNMISVPGIWHVHEPFNPKYGLWPEFFSYGVPDTAQIGKLMNTVLHHVPRGVLVYPTFPSRLLTSRLLPLPKHRVMIKDPIACLLSEHLTESFGLKTVVVFRHPAAFVQSLSALEWNSCHEIRKFLANKSLMCDWLKPHARIMKKYAEIEGLESKAVLHACLNYVLFRFIKRSNRMIGVLHEDLSADPHSQFMRLHEHLELPYDEHVKSHHSSLCYGRPRQEYRAWDTARNSAFEATKWRGKLTKEQVVRIREVWIQFDTPLYDNDRDWLSCN
jgi:hypothetical protein